MIERTLALDPVGCKIFIILLMEYIEWNTLSQFISKTKYTVLEYYFRPFLHLELYKILDRLVQINQLLEYTVPVHRKKCKREREEEYSIYVPGNVYAGMTEPI